MAREQWQKIKEQTKIESDRIFNATSSLNLFWNTEIKWMQLEFNGAYLTKNSPKIKNGAYIMNLYVYELVGIQWW